MKTSNFRSRFEREISEALTKAEVMHEYETEKLYYRLPDSNIEHVYTPDFSFPESSIVIEVKGWPFKKKERNKYRLVKKQNPEIDLRFIFQDAALRIYGKTGPTFGEWARKYGFKWSSRNIPDSWITEILEHQECHQRANGLGNFLMMKAQRGTLRGNLGQLRVD